MLLRVCSFSMAGENEGKRRSCQTVAVILILCSLVPSLTCFSLRWFSKKAPQEKEVSEAAVTEVRPGNILFNGRELSSDLGSVPGNNGLLHVDLDQTGDTETEQMSQLKDIMANEAAWRRLNATLHCGQTQMKLKAMGPGAADLQLNMGNARYLPLTQVPEICGYSLQQNALGLDLVAPYNGCNVIHENGNHVILMSWRETPVKLICHMLPSPDSSPPKSAQHPWNLSFSHGPWSHRRHKRQANLPYYDPRSPYYPYWYYYMQNMRPTTTAAPSTTAEPGTTTTTTKPAAYPYNPYLLYYLYYYYYYSSYYPLPTTTTAAPTTTTGPATNTTASTTKAPPKPSFPFHPPYYHYPYYYPMGQQAPGNGSEIYYYPVIQHFYGKPNPSQTTQPPNPTTKPTEPTEPTEPTSSSVTAASTPTTTSTSTSSSAPTTQTTKPCAQTTTTSTGGGVYPGTMKPYVPYDDQPFVPYVSMDEQKAGKSGPQARSYPHPSFHHWQPVPWFPHSAEQDIPPFDWNNLQP